MRAVVTSVLVAGVIALVCPGLFGSWSARSGDAVPRSIDLPWHWQASVQQDPPGPAAVVATTDDQAGSTQVVGRNGVYRAVYPSAGQWRAGRNVQLSPDGRYLALSYLQDPASAGRGPTIVDLTTGQSRVVSANGLAAHQELAVLAWRPDGGALLLAAVTGPTARLELLSLGTGTVTTLAEMGVPDEWRVAFSPQGDRVSFVDRGSLRLVDASGAALWSVPLSGGRQLAGGGAFTPDGRLIALVETLPCAQPCTGAPSWTVTYVDSADGTDARGPALPAIVGSRVRAIGWTTDGGGTPALVVVRYLPRPRPPAVQGPDGQLIAPPADGDIDDSTGPADLYALAPGAPATLLLDAPYEVTDLDVAADLVRAGRFQGSPSMPSLLPFEPGRLRAVDIGVMAAVLAGLAIVVGVAVKLTGEPQRLWSLVRRLRRS